MSAAKPIIEKMAPLPVPPFILDERIYDVLSESLSLEMNVAQPLRMCRTLSPFSKADWLHLASWTFARKRPSGGKMPQTIAHRGYKAAHPENTMGAFRGAVKAKAHAIETDVHLTKDDVVVLSHVSAA